MTRLYFDNLISFIQDRMRVLGISQNELAARSGLAGPTLNCIQGEGNILNKLLNINSPKNKPVQLSYTEAIVGLVILYLEQLPRQSEAWLYDWPGENRQSSP